MPITIRPASTIGFIGLQETNTIGSLEVCLCKSMRLLTDNLTITPLQIMRVIR
jgi:hypothetical protein